MKEKITDKAVRSLQLPQSGSKITYDTEIRGFGICITANDIRSFVLNYSINARERRYTIGQYPAWSVAAARDRAKVLRQDIDRGIDPLGVKEAERAARTVSDLAKEYEKKHIKNLSAKGQTDVKAMWRDDIIPELGNKRLKDLTSKDVDDLHEKISTTRKVRANRVLEVFRHALNLAVRWQMIDKNPAMGFKKNPEQPKENYLTIPQIKKLFTALGKMPNQQAANVIRLLMLTGARAGEVINAEWSQFDLKKGVWTKPAANTKQRKLHRVPLSVEAIELLKVMEGAKTSDYLFPSSVGKPIADIKRAWEWLIEATKFANLRIHDLRHTYASLLISEGETLPVIGRLLGHTQPQTTMRYAHLMDDPLRAATGKVSNIIGGKRGKNGK